YTKTCCKEDLYKNLCFETEEEFDHKVIWKWKD
ncbi:hypothetical protein A2U01_0073028, partial [Trifolium medium]|nr:hypothetical protein [Trifolium medium]